MKSSKLILILLLFTAITSCEDRRPVYHIPNNYVGEIRINFNIKDGYVPDYSEDYVTYIIPKSGVLNTQTHDFVRLSHVDPVFYYVDSLDNIVKQLPFELIPISLTDYNQVRVFYNSHGVDDSDQYNTYEEYIIDTVKNIANYPRINHAKNVMDSVFSSMRKNVEEK